ncbi:MAG TPA: glycosyltransferase [Pirellulales bacterium]|nr:glycosyltransferase [Pirellulales bacterium]
MIPSFTVVTPSWNQLEWLKLCAASVADQAGVEVEHIVQDAGSGAELEAWAASRPGLRLCVEPDEGMYDAINRGLRRAQGDVCSYLNCDEQYLPGALSKVGDYFAKHPEVEVLFGDAVVIDAAGKPTCYRRMVLPGRFHTSLSHLAVFTCSIFFRRSIVERGLLFDTSWKCIGDAVWVHTLLEKNVKMTVLPVPLAAFTVTGENLSQSPRFLQELERWRTRRGAPPRWLTRPVVWHHRLRRLLAGGYARRSLSLEFYWRDSLDRRKEATVRKLANRWSSVGAWPGNTE